MGAAVVARSVLRSTSVRASASRISGGVKPTSTNFFTRTQKPLSHRIFRSPVEMSCVNVESLFRFHTATASSLLTSMLSTAPYSSGWLIDDS
ncbi:hypothetical protein QVD17_15134 [Tagetes erecta]|uniref:Protein NUCLEAR FUSION DEFECTIVE 6, chloroplastic/mitochondrial-like n=1 Tax=Tagetes erecta TaxID=13708 RepID=A0AAD8KUC5_TARER|nr:hypothetical protein QVD17_15134 [Tagetes erecta]